MYIPEKSTIQIKGTGRASQAPDTVVMNITISADDRVYAAAMRKGAEKVDELKKSLILFGFDSDALKTSYFDIQPIYRREKHFEYTKTVEESVFSHFDCTQNLKLEFEFDNKKLGLAVEAMINCLAKPEFSIDFTIKDIAAFRDKVLESAAKDARRKAEILCSASGVKLGKLLSIDYSWNELEITNSFRCSDRLMSETPASKPSYNFNPDDVDAEDTVDFVWEIEN